MRSKYKNIIFLFLPRSIQVLKFIRFEVRFARREMRITFGRKPGPDEEGDPETAAREEAKWTEGKRLYERQGTEAAERDERILPRMRRRRGERANEVGREFISPVSHLEPSAARLKFHLGRADVIKTNYAYGTVMPHHFIP